MNYSYGEAPCTNVFWYRNGNAQEPGLSDFATFVHYVGSQWASRIAPNQHNAVEYLGSEGLYYGPAGSDLGATGSFGGNGGHTGAGNPANVALCVSWGIQQHYKGGHPRTYIGGIPSEVNAGVTSFDGGYCSDVAADANSYINDILDYSIGNLSDLHLGVVSFVLRKQWREPPVFRDYSPGGATCDTRMDTQRRRLGRDRPA